MAFVLSLSGAGSGHAVGTWLWQDTLLGTGDPRKAVTVIPGVLGGEEHPQGDEITDSFLVWFAGISSRKLGARMVPRLSYTKRSWRSVPETGAPPTEAGGPPAAQRGELAQHPGQPHWWHLLQGVSLDSYQVSVS